MRRLKLLSALVICFEMSLAQEAVFSFQGNELAEFYRGIDQKKIVVLGETHGTNEIPLFLFDLIKTCQSVSGRIAIGVEVNENYQRDIDDYMRTGNIQILRNSGFFNTEFKDGRSSQAVALLLNNIRGLNRVRVFCFDNDIRIQHNRDSVMAENISKNLAQGVGIV